MLADVVVVVANQIVSNWQNSRLGQVGDARRSRGGGQVGGGASRLARASHHHEMYHIIALLVLVSDGDLVAKLVVVHSDC